MARKQKQTIYTIGHSTRTLDELLDLLRENGITMLVDIRTVPRSRTNPQFNTDLLERELPHEGIAYKHMPDLGGLRRAKPDSENTVWENASFRGYADYMETERFREAISELLRMAEHEQIAIMCAEAVWWRCHRGMVSDELIARGVTVQHILGPKVQTHTLRSFAHVDHGHVSYHS
jgi:uncharacterized protein (DUF488 family)